MYAFCNRKARIILFVEVLCVDYIKVKGSVQYVNFYFFLFFRAGREGCLSSLQAIFYAFFL